MLYWFAGLFHDAIICGKLQAIFRIEQDKKIVTYSRAERNGEIL
jgi:hypothetical protein